MPLVALAVASSGVPHAQADEPSCRYSLTTDTVLDNDTGLIWQRNVHTTSIIWDNAKQYCSDLSLGGSNDWRLPTIHELQTIMDVRLYNPAIDPAAFPNTPPEQFWSSSLYAGNPGSAWFAHFIGFDVATASVGNSYRVRCVR
jgi:hypothetical protein